MRFQLLIVFFLCCFSAVAQEDIIIGKTSHLYSEILQEDRILEIHLPKNYDKDPDKTYPVLYLLDSYFNFSHAVGTVDYLYLNRLIPEMIIVGVRNTNRNRDLSPESPDLSQEEQDRLGLTGQADDFMAFLEQELIPYIRSVYRAAPYEVLTGHSLGGLFSTYTFFKNPKLFDAYITISPSLWYHNDLISKEFEEVFEDLSDLSASFYLTIASENKGTMRGDTYKLSGRFMNYINKHEKADLRFHFEPMPEETHQSTGLPALFNGLRFVFAPTQYEIPRTREEIIGNGGPEQVIQDVQKYFEKLTEKYGFQVDDQETLIDLGFALMRLDDFKEDAIKAFGANVAAHPESFDAYSTLGMAYEQVQQLQKAKENYEMALKLVKRTENPEWEFYQADLDRVNRKIANKDEASE